jgi:hypothetical protein
MIRKENVMNTKYISAIAVAAILVGGNAAMAQGMGQGMGQGQHGHGQQPAKQQALGQSGMMPMHQQMMTMHKGMMQGGMMQGGMKGKAGPMGPEFRALLDTNEDGRIEPAEARAALETLLSDNDANDDGALDISEFEILHSRMIRESMVDRFQHLDNDGDGAITAGEMAAPAKKIEKKQKRMERMQNARDMPQNGMKPGAMMQDGAGKQSN